VAGAEKVDSVGVRIVNIAPLLLGSLFVKNVGFQQKGLIYVKNVDRNRLRIE
jgi:hypothetical protein